MPKRVTLLSPFFSSDIIGRLTFGFSNENVECHTFVQVINFLKKSELNYLKFGFFRAKNYFNLD